MPLETAEQFLLTLGSISNLEARLKLWTFKLDFKVGIIKLWSRILNLQHLKGDGKRHLRTLQSSEGRIKGCAKE